MPQAFASQQEQEQKYSYVFLSKLNLSISKLDDETQVALLNWFERNGFSYAQETKKGNATSYRFLYEFDLKKLESDLHSQSRLDDSRINRIISAISGACEKKKPSGIKPRALDEDMPFMKKKENIDERNI